MHTLLVLAFFPLLFSPANEGSFLSDQKTHDRVNQAYAEKETLLTKMLSPFHLDLSDLNILIVAYKSEQELNVYGKKKSEDTYQKLFTYKICKSSGQPGPKRMQGDRQVPEGFYHIEVYNPTSDYYLSLGINYPNRSDSIKSKAPKLGGDIYIHGDCVTVGCLPMTDDKIKEIYVLALQAHANGQDQIPVYIFPFKFSESNMDSFKEQYKADDALLGFWNNLKTGCDRFQSTLRELNVSIDDNGEYMHH
jgi:murein L,D-transpeptidase YafK